jgi:two-component system OmpR family response regulator
MTLAILLMIFLSGVLSHRTARRAAENRSCAVVPGVARILVVEDDEIERRLLNYLFGSEGYEVIHLPDVTTALLLLERFPPDLAVVDVRLGGESGLDLVEPLRERHPGIPIIFLSAADDPADRLAGLDAGANVYLTKPFDPHELLAYVKNELRRGSTANIPKSIPVHLIVDQRARRASYRGCALDLTAMEFDLLVYLFARRGQVVARDELRTALWRSRNVNQNALDKRLSVLRRKLDIHGPGLIRTVRGAGFVLRDEAHR